MSAQPVASTVTVDAVAADPWNQERLRALVAPHGFLAVTALHWLADEPTRLFGAPGPVVPGGRLRGRET